MTTSYDQNVIAAFNSIQPFVASVSGLNVSVGSFAYILNGTAGTYAGVSSVAVTDDVIPLCSSCGLNIETGILAGCEECTARSVMES